MISHGHLLRKVCLSCVTASLVAALLASSASAYIGGPSIEELVDSADLIVTRQVSSVRMTSSALVRQISLTIMVALGPVLTFMAWRKRGISVACVVALSLAIVMGFLLGPRPASYYYRVASVSVSRTIKGPDSLGNILVFYDQHHPCDESHLAVQQNCLLFLKKTSSGYTTSWYDWSVWIIEQGYAQTVRGGRHDTPPVELNQLISKIERFVPSSGLAE